MSEYAPNSNKFKQQQQETHEERKKVDKVVTGPVTLKKKSGVSKFVDVFISEDVENVKSYILSDVLIPAIKNTILDIITDSANMFLGGSKSRKSTSGGSKISYRNFYERRDERSRPVESENRPRFDYDEIGFESRGEAQAVRDQMDEIISTYGVVTVADLYDMADLTQPYTSNRYGWIDISTADIIRRRDGKYVIKLPKARPIDR